MKPLFTLFALVALLAGCGREATPPPADIRSVRVEQVASTRAMNIDRFAGEVRARHETALAFRVSGRVSARKVEVGTQVKVGQVIATLDPQDYALAVRAAQAQLTAAEAEAQLAQQDLKRFTGLHAQHFIAEAELDRRRTVAEAAHSRVRQFRAEAARLGNQQTYTQLTAPHAGVVTALGFETGQVVAAGQPLVQLARLGELEVNIDMPENVLDSVRAAQTLTIRLWAQPDKTYSGKLRELAPMAEAVSRTYSARVSLLQPDPAVKLGMTATVEISQEAVPSLSVAQAALFKVNGQPQVWVVDQKTHRVAARSVRLGALSGERAAVVSGLVAGEWVVTAGVHKLAPGQVVRSTPPAQP